MVDLTRVVVNFARTLDTSRLGGFSVEGTWLGHRNLGLRYDGSGRLLDFLNDDRGWFWLDNDGFRLRNWNRNRHRLGLLDGGRNRGGTLPVESARGLVQVGHIVLSEVVNARAESLAIIILNLIVAQQLVCKLAKRHIRLHVSVHLFSSVLECLSVVVFLVRLIHAEVCRILVNFSAPVVDALVNFHAEYLLLLLVAVKDNVVFFCSLSRHPAVAENLHIVVDHVGARIRVNHVRPNHPSVPLLVLPALRHVKAVCVQRMVSVAPFTEVHLQVVGLVS